MEDFTRNIKLRALQVSDFYRSTKTDFPNHIETEYHLYDFKLEGDLNAGYNYFKHDASMIFWIKYSLDDCIIFDAEADTLEEVIEAFNDWRMKIYSDLLLLSDNKTITIKMTGYANNFLRKETK